MPIVRWMMAASLAASVGASAAATIDVAGVNFDDEATVAAQRLVLNGAGIRTRVVFKVYVAALYLAQRKDVSKDVLAAPGAKRVAVTMLREVASDDLGQALMDGIRNNTPPDEMARLDPQLTTMMAVFKKIPVLKRGDNFSVDWIPDTGTVVLVGGKPATEPIPDKAFYDAVLRIWLGDEPADASLKKAMLGK